MVHSRYSKGKRRRLEILPNLVLGRQAARPPPALHPILKKNFSYLKIIEVFSLILLWS